MTPFTFTILVSDVFRFSLENALKWFVHFPFAIIKNYSPKVKWLLLNNSLDFVSGIIQQ